MLRCVLSTLVFLAGATTAIAGGSTAFVSTQGNDTGNNCSSPVSPCRTLSHAAIAAASADSIHVAGGLYKDDAALFENPGSVAIRGSYNESFSVQDSGNPTVLRSKGTRPLTFSYDGTGGSITLDRIRIEKSSQIPGPGPETDRGGGVLVHSTNSANVSVLVSNVVMEGNAALVGGGLAVLAEDGGTASVVMGSSTFAKNKAQVCAGVLLESANSPPVQVNIATSTFEKNKAAEFGGALCMVIEDPSLTETLQVLNRLTFVKNKAFLGGGVVAAVIEGGHQSIHMRNSVFLKNKAATGAAVFAASLPADAVGAEVEFVSINNTLNKNKAKEGGAIALLAETGFSGPAINDSTVTMDSTNDIVFDNKGGAASVGALTGATAQLTRQYGIYGSVATEGDGAIVDGPGLSDDDPNFIKDGKDIHLVSPSPAINAGTCDDGPNEDFEAQFRPSGATCDIGADEFIE